MNQKDIADRLNLSRTTVSRCFTNHPKINPETRAKVFQLASRLGYVYAPPRNHRTGDEKGRTVVVLVAQPLELSHESETTRRILVGISDRLAEEGLHLKLHREDPERFVLGSRPRRILPELSNEGILGFILLYPFQQESVANLSAKFPVITALDDYERLEVDSVDVDAGRGISRLMDRLASAGHRETAFISWRYKVATPWVERRFGAYVAGLYRLGLSFDESRVVNVRRVGQIEPEAVLSRAIEWVRSGVTALVCAADHQAYPLMAGLRAAGVRVPEDVSVTGFDGIEPPSGELSLTTIRQPFRDIGYSTVVSLLRRVSSPAAPRRHILVGGRLIEGETVCPPRTGSIT